MPNSRDKPRDHRRLRVPMIKFTNQLQGLLFNTRINNDFIGETVKLFRIETEKRIDKIET